MTALAGRVLARCFTLFAVSFLVVFCFDAAVFRSGFYKRVVSPESSAGSVQDLIRIERSRLLPFPRRVLMLGNSQQAEGFSAKVASEALAKNQISIVNGGVPGVTMRDWFYMVRDLDPRATRYNVIVFPLPDYADLDYNEPEADRIQDLNFVIGSLRLTDLIPFTLSFPSWQNRWIAFRGGMLQGLTYRDDLRDFLHAPRLRLAIKADHRLHGMEWQDSYSGLQQNLEGLTFSPENHSIHFPPGVPSETQNLVRSRLDLSGASIRGYEREFARRWLTALEDHYRNREVRFVFFRMPQYPVHLTLRSADQDSIVNTMGKQRQHIVMNPAQFDWLESPNYAADGLHLNATGRIAFSRAFAEEISRALSGFWPKAA